MKNAHQDGRILDLTLTAPVESGGVVVQGSIVGVAITRGNVGDTIAVAVEGVFRLPKQPSASFSAGDAVSWAIAGYAALGAAQAGDIEKVGYATEAASGNRAMVLVRLCPRAA